VRSGTRSFTTYTEICGQIRGLQWYKRKKHTVRERIDLRVLILTRVNATETGEGVLAIDVHGARATDTLST
jgi:tRNA U34 5-carboxymethylaminomethyl modifying GTPase MnmE/TrmE